MSSNKSIKVTFIECFMFELRGFQWAGMRVEGHEKRGGVCEPSSLATQWVGGCSLSNSFLQRNGWVFFPLMLSGVHWCSEKLQWGRVWMVEWKCQLVTASIGIVLLLGTVGKCQPTKKTSETCGMRAFWFVAPLHNSWQPLSIAATNNFQLPGNYTKRKQMFDSIFAHF